MPLPPKEYFALDEVRERWNMPGRDLVYYAENGIIEVAAKVVGVVLETGLLEVESRERWSKIPEDQLLFSGVAPLRERDLLTVFRQGTAQIYGFRAGEGRYLDIFEPADGIEVGIHDLVVTREERDRFEREHKVIDHAGRQQQRTDSIGDDGFEQHNDYAEVRLGGQSYRLGTCQAAVVRMLHNASRTGSPWRSGKIILGEARSACTRMRDLFKTQPDWRKLIKSDGRGLYRLNLPTRPADK